MDFEQSQYYLSQKPEAQLCYPFDPDIMVFKVTNKMFALLSPNGGKNPNQLPQMNLKCDPDQAQELRDVFDAVKPGYHMNKRHWNTIILDDTIPSSEIERMINHSYTLVVKGLRKSELNQLLLHYPEEVLFAQ
jgi:predicted DNA-binding protein (MmcQ/YjbR family)